MNCKFSFICLSLILLFFSNIMAQPETKVIAFVSKTSVVDENGVLADKPFIDDLLSEGYKIDTLYTTALETSDSLINVLNSADLVIIGRSGGSGDFGGAHKAAWNAITTPILLLHPWAARNSRLNWLPTGTTNSFDTGGDTISAKIEVPDDTVFVDATIEADSTMDWVYTPYDYMGTTDGGNGTVLARSADGNVLFERWDPWVEFYNGTHDGAAGYRTLIGNGNDHANATSGAPFNYYNFTPAAKQVYLNEVARMLNLPAPPPKPIGFGKTIAFVGLPGKDNPDTPEEGDADKPFIDDLVAAGYTVNTVYTSSLETASQGFVDSLNNADLVIIGRSGSSGDFGGTHKAAWNAITSPLMALHLFVARNNRLNWLPTATATAYDNVGDTMIAKIEVPDDPVFTDATIAADSTMGWVVSPYDYMETTDGGNGTVLARDASNSNVLFVRWDPWVYFYNGAGDYAAGYRTYIGNGNDHASASTGGPFNYYNFTDEAKQVYMNEVARMANLPAPPEKPAGLGKTIAFISLPGKLDENGVDADKPFIDDLEALEYTVDTHYSSSLESDSALVDTLNNVELAKYGDNHIVRYWR
jgi:hypothetical protein